MTEIKLEKIGNRYVVDIKGHAGYADNGKDVVCAGISILSESFTYYCDSIQDLDRCTVIDEAVDLDEGRLRFVVEGETKYIDPAFEMMRIGLSAIAENYPKYVRM